MRDSAVADSEAMDVDTSTATEVKRKRKAEEEHPVTETTEGKKPRLGKSFIVVISSKL